MLTSFKLTYFNSFHMASYLKFMEFLLLCLIYGGYNYKLKIFLGVKLEFEENDILKCLYSFNLLPYIFHI